MAHYPPKIDKRTVKRFFKLDGNIDPQTNCRNVRTDRVERSKFKVTRQPIAVWALELGAQNGRI